MSSRPTSPISLCSSSTTGTNIIEEAKATSLETTVIGKVFDVALRKVGVYASRIW